MARLNHEKINRQSKVTNRRKTGSKPYIKIPKSEGTVMRSKYPGKCGLCQDKITQGSTIYYLFEIKTAFHIDCKERYSL